LDILFPFRVPVPFFELKETLKIKDRCIYRDTARGYAYLPARHKIIYRAEAARKGAFTARKPRARLV
jgi:hypothetical protein